MRAALAIPGPVYFRVAKLAVPDVLDPGETFEFGRGVRLREGRT